MAHSILELISNIFFIYPSIYYLFFSIEVNVNGNHNLKEHHLDDHLDALDAK